MHTGCPGISSTFPASEAEDIDHEGGGLVYEVGEGGMSAEMTSDSVWAVSY